MKSILKGIILSALVVAAPAVATAADATKQPAHDWSGAYVGGYLGGGWASKEWTLISNAGNGQCGQCGSVVTDYSLEGMIGGIQLGYNRQFDNWVFGVEGDLGLTGLEGTGTWTGGNPSGTRSGKTDINWLATLGPKGGWAMDRILLSVEGGLALAGEDYSSQGQDGISRGSATRAGWFVGASAEYAVNAKWSLKFDYNYLNFGTKQVSLTRDQGNSGPTVFDIKQDMHTAKIGLNYHF